MRRNRVAPPTHRTESFCSMEALESRQLLSGVTDDRFEDNDLPRTVVRAAEGAPNSPNLGSVAGVRVIRNLQLCDSADVFRIVLQGRGASDNFVRINFNSARGDLDLELLGAGGRVLRTAAHPSGPETISLQGLAAAAYFVRITGRNGATNPNYTLTINAPTGVVNPNEDAYEENDSLEQVSAATAGAVNSPNLGAIAAPRTLSGLKLNDSYDIFKFSINSTLGSVGKYVHVTTVAPLNLVLFSSTGQSLRSAVAYLGQSTIDLNGLAAGEYFVQVTHYALGTAGVFNYDLNFNL